MNMKRWTVAFVVSLLIGLVAGRARALDMTKALTGNPGDYAGGRYPVDHSVVGSGIDPTIPGGIDSNSAKGGGTVPCGPNGVRSVCYQCTSYFNGTCFNDCYGSQTCDDGPSAIFGNKGQTCASYFPCKTPGSY